MTLDLRHHKFAALIEPAVAALGCELWGLEWLRRGRGTLLRVYIDKASGIDLDDCERVARQLGSLLDVEDPIAEEYTLEVSSPGLDRPLFTLDQCRQFIGADVNVRLRSPLEGRRRYRGRLRAVGDEHIVLEMGGQEYSFPFTGIDRANLVPSF